MTAPSPAEIIDTPTPGPSGVTTSLPGSPDLPPELPPPAIQPNVVYTIPHHETPPTYEQSLNHQLIERHGAGPGGGRAHPDAERGIPRGIATTMEEAEEREAYLQMMLPPMHMGMAVTCAIFNFIIPGSGSMMAAFGLCCCTPKCRFWNAKTKLQACCINLGVGFSQLILTPLMLVGWMWSILWGLAYMGVSNTDYHSPKPPSTNSTPRRRTSRRRSSCLHAHDLAFHQQLNQHYQRRRSSLRTRSELRGLSAATLSPSLQSLPNQVLPMHETHHTNGTAANGVILTARGDSTDSLD